VSDRRGGGKPGALEWVVLAGVILVLHGMGRGPLSPPPLSSAHHLATWWQQRGPMVATFAAAREALWWFGCYLLALGLLTAVAARRPSARLIQRLCRYRVPGATTLIRASIGASALGASLFAQSGSSFAAGGGGAASQGDAAASAPPVLRYAGPDRGASVPFEGGPDQKSDHNQPPPSTIRTASGAAPGPPAPTHRPARATPVTGRPGSRRLVPASPEESGPTRTWTVRPGDSLWSIAEMTLSAAWAHPPGRRDLARYWWRVVQTNRPSLPVPANPDLLFPGDEVVIPTPPPPPGTGD
jgi:hypothetical protein